MDSPLWEFLPELFGDKRHERMKQTQCTFEHVKCRLRLLGVKLGHSRYLCRAEFVPEKRYMARWFSCRLYCPSKRELPVSHGRGAPDPA